MDLHSTGEGLVMSSEDSVILEDPRVIMRLIQIENHYIVTENYFGSVQDEITPRMRRELLEWLLEVAEAESCENPVFPLTVYFVDRYLSLVRVEICHLQLLGCICLLLASKLRQSRPLRPAALAAYTANTYRVSEILEWEYEVLNMLKWNLAAVIPIDYFDTIFYRLPDFARVRRMAYNHANTFQQLSLMEFEFAAWPPSLIALASIAVAIRGLPNIQIVWPYVDELIYIFHNMTNIDMHTISNCIEYMEEFIGRCIRRVQQIRTAEAVIKGYDEAYGDDNPDTPPDLHHVLI